MKTIKDVMPNVPNYIDIRHGGSDCFNRANYDDRECVVAFKKTMNKIFSFVIKMSSAEYRTYTIVHSKGYRHDWIAFMEDLSPSLISEWEIIDPVEFEKFKIKQALASI